jgi:hypothetical protein
MLLNALPCIGVEYLKKGSSTCETALSISFAELNLILYSSQMR